MRRILLVLAALAGSPLAAAQKAPDSYPGGVYNATPPSLADKQASTLQFDTAGNLKIVSSGSGVATVTQGPQAGTATGNTWFFQGAGTAGTPVGGLLTVQGAVGGTALPVSGTVTITPSGTQNVTGTGTAGSAAAGVITVQGIASGTALSVTDTTPVAQGSTTSGQLGPLVQCAVTTAIPSYTNAQTSPCSLTTVGAIRTVITGSGGNTMFGSMTTAASASLGGGFGALGIYNSSAPTLTTGQTVGLQLDSAGNLLTSGRPITPVVSASAENSHVLKASAGNLFSVYATNLTATAGFLVVLNSTTAPGDGAITPLACVPLAANGNASLNYNPGPPAAYSTGITAVVTSASTCFTKTTGTITAFISGSAQ